MRLPDLQGVSEEITDQAFYIPFVFIAIAWAFSIHTVTAFLYVGLGGRPLEHGGRRTTLASASRPVPPSSS